MCPPGFVGDVQGWWAALWAIVPLCLPALAAVVVAAPDRAGSNPGTAVDGPAPTAGRELASLRSRPVQVHLALAVLVKAATFCTFAHLALTASGPAGIADRAVAPLLALFSVAAFLDVAVAGRFGDRHGRTLIAGTAPFLVAGWVLLALTATSPAALWVLAPVQGALSFALGSTVVARIVATAHAPTMGGSFATAALNVGAVLGPVTGGVALDAVGVRGPVVVSAASALAALVVWWPASRVART